VSSAGEVGVEGESTLLCMLAKGIVYMYIYMYICIYIYLYLYIYIYLCVHA